MASTAKRVHLDLVFDTCAFFNSDFGFSILGRPFFFLTSKFGS